MIYVPIRALSARAKLATSAPIKVVVDAEARLPGRSSAATFRRSNCSTLGARFTCSLLAVPVIYYGVARVVVVVVGSTWPTQHMHESLKQMLTFTFFSVCELFACFFLMDTNQTHTQHELLLAGLALTSTCRPSEECLKATIVQCSSLNSVTISMYVSASLCVYLHCLLSTRARPAN